MHTVAVVITNDGNWEGALAPFDQDLEIEQYVVVEKAEILEMLHNAIKNKTDFYNTIKYHEFDLTNDETLLASYRKYEKEKYDSEFDEEGNEVAMHNPNTVWDWYVLGGRWEGELLRDKDGKPTDIGWVKDLDPEFGVLNIDSMKYTPEVLFDGEFFNEVDSCRNILSRLKHHPEWHVAIVDYHI